MLVLKNKSTDTKWQILKRLPSDYKDYGGEVERWGDDTLDYPDCSSGCKHFAPLHDFDIVGHDLDWGVCMNIKASRAGLLTWEHQSGFECFESSN
jgi:hypothetical protein